MTPQSVDKAANGSQGSRAREHLPRVLIVDDSRESANSLCTLFGKRGYKADVAYDWATALEMARANFPDVILLDIGMPEMDGVHLGRYFREDEQFKDKVLIAVTGYADPMHRQQCEGAGFDHFLSKPVCWEDLKETIDRHWSKRKMG